jgi:DNA primase small subunit
MAHTRQNEDPSTLDQDMSLEIEINLDSQTSETIASETQHGDTQASKSSDEMALEPRAPDTTQPLTKAEETSEVKLEDLFADVESDEEFPSSAPVMKDEGSPEPPEFPM